MRMYLNILAGAALVLGSSTAMTGMAAADDKPVSMIQCGDTLAETYPDLIKAWEGKNPGYKVSVELVGWAQCQDKVTTLAAAGTPVALAYVGSRTLKTFADSDLIIPIPYTDAEKAAYYPHIVDTVTFKGQAWGLPTAFSTKALFWNKDLFTKAGLDPAKPPTTWDELYADAKQIKDKTGVAGYGLPAKTMDNTMHQFLHFVYTNDGSVNDADGVCRQGAWPADAGRRASARAGRLAAGSCRSAPDAWQDAQRAQTRADGVPAALRHRL